MPEADRASVETHLSGPRMPPGVLLRIEISYSLLALLRDLQIPECIADIGTDRLHSTGEPCHRR
jgi:hypothetical protein